MGEAGLLSQDLGGVVVIDGVIFLYRFRGFRPGSYVEEAVGYRHFSFS